MNKFKRLIGYLLYNCIFGLLPHYQLGLDWIVEKNCGPSQLNYFSTSVGKTLISEE